MCKYKLHVVFPWNCNTKAELTAALEKKLKSSWSLVVKQLAYLLKKLQKSHL